MVYYENKDGSLTVLEADTSSANGEVIVVKEPVNVVTQEQIIEESVTTAEAK